MKRLFFFLFGLCSFYAGMADEPFGIVNVSVCNTRNEADYNSAQESQGALFGNCKTPACQVLSIEWMRLVCMRGIGQTKWW